MTDLQIERATGPGTPDISVPIPRQAADPPIVDPPVGSALPPDEDGVDLGRLLRLAGLTPEQAIEVGAGLLAAVAGRTDPDGSDEVPAGRIVMGMDGRVLLGPAPDGGHDGVPPTGGAPGVVVGAVLVDVARAARRRAGPDADPMLDRLDQAVVELPVIGLPAVARALGEAAAAADRAAVRAELGALARAIGGPAGPAQRVGPRGRSVRPAGLGAARRARRTPERRTADRRVVPLDPRARRGRAAGVRPPARQGRHRHRRPARCGTQRVDAVGRAPTPDGLPVVPPAPAAAGSVRGVDLRPLSACTPGAPCSVRVLVRVVPGAGPQVVTWSYRIVDRCSGAVVPVPGGTASVAAGQERVAVVGSVALPTTTPAVGLVAVTEAPAVAASVPGAPGLVPAPAG